MFLLIASGSLVLAQEETSTTTTETATAESGTDWKQEISGDRQAVAEEWDVLKEHGQEARTEERQLQHQIFDAAKAGDFTTAKSLREQLRTMRQENVQQKQEDFEALKEAKQGLRKDIKEAHQEGSLPPKVRDRVEDVRDHRENIRDRREDIRDHREDILDKREDVWDAAHNPPPGTKAYRRDKLEDIRDTREDVRDRKEDVKDRRENIRDRREDIKDKKNIHDSGLHKGHDIGIRDRGKGVDAGKGQGVAANRGPLGGRGHGGGGVRHR